MNNITNYYGDLGIFLYYTPIVSAFMAAFALLANRRRTPSQTWLALVLVTFGTGMAASFLFDRYFRAIAKYSARSILSFPRQIPLSFCFTMFH